MPFVNREQAERGLNLHFNVVNPSTLCAQWDCSESKSTDMPVPLKCFKVNSVDKNFTHFKSISNIEKLLEIRNLTKSKKFAFLPILA